MAGLCVVGLLWLCAPAAPDFAPDDVSFGVGWAVSHATSPTLVEAGSSPRVDASQPAAAAADDDDAQTKVANAATTEPAAPRPKAPPPKVRPFAHRSDLDARIREARRARAIATGFAGAVMGATAAYGIMRAVEAQHEMAAIRNEPRPSQFKPMHPR